MRSRGTNRAVFGSQEFLELLALRFVLREVLQQGEERSSWHSVDIEVTRKNLSKGGRGWEMVRQRLVYEEVGYSQVSKYKCRHTF